ncbi:M48 family metallopeptidase [Perlucidibaca piscinae]|uniref:M48 family metallopeptidase n=1 Tax=Perlucidibaca piscinae TaxID=392589 RepID=UPI0003B31D51|nr:M48 family metallopeptidase [Perlucidibaca piscinae]
MSRWVWRTAVAGMSAAVLVACVNTTQTGAVGVNRSQLLLLSSAQVDAMAVQSYREELTQARSKNRLNTDKANLERIRKIADRLIPGVAAFRNDALGWQWEVNLETREELNAYCAPGGKIMFFTGIITKLKLTDDEIAAIMGHEMAHALREHGRERMSHAYAQSAGINLIGAVTGMSQGTGQLLQTAAQVGLSLPHSRGQETEADVLGLELLARAGYNPNAAVTLWQKMAAATGGSSGSFLSTHPGSGQRIQSLQAAIPRVMPLYEQARRQGVRAPAVVPRT